MLSIYCYFRALVATGANAVMIVATLKLISNRNGVPLHEVRGGVWEGQPSSKSLPTTEYFSFLEAS